MDHAIFTNLDQNLVISAQYVPPVSSKYYGQNTINKLRGDLLKFCNESTPTILVGDFNARTGNILDNLEIDPHFDNLALENTEFRNRNNRDGEENAQGKKLINTLRTRDLRILNGRMIGDLLGNFKLLKTVIHP